MICFLKAFLFHSKRSNSFQRRRVTRNLEPCIYLKTRKLLLFTKGHNKRGCPPGAGGAAARPCSWAAASLSPKRLCALLSGPSPSPPLRTFWNLRTVFLFGIPHVFHGSMPLPLAEKKKGGLLPWGSFTKGAGPAGTAAAVHPRATRATWSTCLEALESQDPGPGTGRNHPPT